MSQLMSLNGDMPISQYMSCLSHRVTGPQMEHAVIDKPSPITNVPLSVPSETSFLYELQHLCVVMDVVAGACFCQPLRCLTCQQANDRDLGCHAGRDTCTHKDGARKLQHWQECLQEFSSTDERTMLDKDETAAYHDAANLLAWPDSLAESRQNLCMASICWQEH